MGKASKAKKPVYKDPTRPVEERVKDLISRMTLVEKASQMVNKSDAIPRLDIPAYEWWSECLHGVMKEGATIFPQAIALGASWDPDLVYRVNTAISDEARVLHHQGKSGLDYWSPVINILRDPRWGRTQEGFGEDPYLVSRIAVACVKGLQGNDRRYLKVVATPKHFALNNVEVMRHTGSSNVDEPLLRNYYLPHFRAVVSEARAHSIMGSYNQINGVPACANEKMLTKILREEWGFDGYVVSDCGAITDIWSHHHYAKTPAEATAKAIKAGCDLECGSEYKAHLAEAVREGLITEKEVDKALARLFRARFLLGMFDPPQKVAYSKIPERVLDGPRHRALARETARKGCVLLKNEGNMLPLSKKTKTLAVIGPQAEALYFGNYSGSGVKAVTPLQGIKDRFSGSAKILYEEGCDIVDKVIPTEYLVPNGGKPGEHGLTAEYFNNDKLNGKPMLTRLETVINIENSTLPKEVEDDRNNSMSMRWTGKLIPPVTRKYRFTSLSKTNVSFYLDNKLLFDYMFDFDKADHAAEVELKAGKAYDIRVESYLCWANSKCRLCWDYYSEEDMERAVRIAAKADAAIVCLGTDEEVEGEGRDRLDMELPAVQKELLKRVVKANPRVILVLFNGSPLSLNWEKKHIPAILEMWYAGEESGNALADILSGDANPGGKLPVTFYKSVNDLLPMTEYDIRKGATYLYFKKEPLFPFGYGLSYTTFELNSLKVSPKKAKGGHKIAVTVKLKNTGKRDGDEVVQLYLSRPVLDAPKKELKGFKRVFLKAGKNQTVTFELTSRELSYYNRESKEVVDPGEYGVMVGTNSSQGLKASFELI